MIKPKAPPKKAIFSEKWHISAIFNPKTLIFKYVPQNNHRKLLVKSGEKILIGSIFGIFQVPYGRKANNF